MEKWTAFHFSQANPAGEGQENVSTLLRRVADSLEGLGQVEILDITFHAEVIEDRDYPSMTVYYVDIDQHS